jgi:hypothetical protein
VPRESKAAFLAIPLRDVDTQELQHMHRGYLMAETNQAVAHAALPTLPLSDAARSEQLGIDPFPAAFDLIYGMVDSVLTKAGGRVTA